MKFLKGITTTIKGDDVRSAFKSFSLCYDPELCQMDMLGATCGLHALCHNELLLLDRS